MSISTKAHLPKLSPLDDARGGFSTVQPLTFDKTAIVRFKTRIVPTHNGDHSPMNMLMGEVDSVYF
jgi:hypothetical protein